MPRTFIAKDAVREQVPLLIGLFGASGSGKTFSALRLSTGIQSVTGGDIYVVDTEARRSLHYAELFKFQHVEFSSPFGSLDYLDVIRWCVKDKGARIVVIDSASHEHEGEGGYLWLHEKEVERMAGGDPAKAERVKMAGWIRPAAQRRAFINGLLQLNANFIFCFRAKEKTKPVKGGGILEMGFMPIAGDEFLFEMTVNGLLMPQSNGIPTWKSDKVGENLMMKLPVQFKNLFSQPTQLSEEHGHALAEWAKGGSNGHPVADYAERIAAVEQGMKGANTIVGVGNVWNRAAKLRAELATAAPELLDSLGTLHDARLMELEAH